MSHSLPFTETFSARGEKRFGSFGQRPKPRIGLRCRLVCACLLSLAIAFNKDRPHTKPLSELDVRQRIPDHYAGLGLNVGKVAPRLLEHAGKRLAAVALLLVVRTEVEGVNARFRRLERILEHSVNRLDIAG